MATLVQNLTATIITLGDLPPGGNIFQPYEVKDLEFFYNRALIDNSNILRNDIHIGLMVRVPAEADDPLTRIADNTEVLSDLASDSPLDKINVTTIITLVPSGSAAGQPLTLKEYPTGATAGSPAKLTTYTYTDPSFPTRATSVIVTDTTV